MIAIPAPESIHGDALTAELRDAGLTDAAVHLDGDTLVVSGTDDQATVEQVVAAHVPPPPPEPLPTYEELVAEVRGIRERAAQAAVTGDAAKIRDAVAGPRE